MKQRRLWTDFEDMALALTILNLKRQGYTYKTAFEVAGTNIDRTAKGCSSRWYRKVKTMTNDLLGKDAEKAKEVKTSKTTKKVLVS